MLKRVAKHTATKPLILHIRVGLDPHHFGGSGFAPRAPDPLLDPQHFTELKHVALKSDIFLFKNCKEISYKFAFRSIAYGIAYKFGDFV
jgi:hypothetical protein